MAKRAVIGFKGIALAPIVEDSLTAYVTEAGKELPFAGAMSRTAKESTTDLYYDDGIYAQIKDVQGEDVEIRVAEMTSQLMQEYGLGTFNETTNTFEGDFTLTGKEFALRFVTDTVSGLPYYYNYRVFEMNGVKLDNHTTKKDSITICEVIITGVLKKPRMPGLASYARMEMLEDKSNAEACNAFLAAAESKGTPAANG